jgi:hypothetical protein
VLVTLTAIAIIAIGAPYFFAQGATDWLRRSLSLLVTGEVGFVVLITVGGITYFSLVKGGYHFGAIFASLAVLFLIFAAAIFITKAIQGRLDIVFFLLSIIMSIIFALFLSIAVTFVRRLLS